MNAYLGEDLILVLSPPRSGSTMLQRILGSHSAVQTHPEPHILTPLAFQGYFRQVDRAAYNHKVAATALREFVEFLPRGEEDYLDACREYCRVLYGRARQVNERRFFLDKTPNYADTILPFIARLLPRARIVVLSRHPLAQLASTAHTFYGGDFYKAHGTRDRFTTFIPAIAGFMRKAEVPYIHVRYEALVTDPETEVRRLLDFIGLPFEPACIRFGEQEHITKTYGDPKIASHKAPVRDSIDSWVKDLVGRPDRVRLCQAALAPVPDADLETFGYPRAALWQPLQDALGPRGAGDGLAWQHRAREWRWQLERMLRGGAGVPLVQRGLRLARRATDRLIVDGGPSA